MEEDNHEKQLDDGGSSSLFKTCFNALNAFSGIGILSVPYSLARGGWMSLSLLLLLAATAFYTSLLITKCMNADRSVKTYPDIGERAFGRPGRIIVSVFMHLELYLVTTGFLILEGDNLHNLFPGFNIKMIGLRLNGKQSFMASVALVIMPTLWWDNLSVLSYVSMSGVLATVLTLGSISWVGADTSDNMQVEAFIWANKDDPDMYGEWDFEEWKRLHMEKFIEASEKFIEWKKNPDGRSREEFAKFVEEDPPVA
ncbi:hypothetical protein F2Q70_00032032 [Brassica cretica]|uniref:Amino acid transporter transmembrane domain-containing protein n=1 Tax=Brassica cretica TaxID=69181 RepID=A0A8S9FS56_BRACR|nr:hypothetical protein F2Q70_00032032 [Brassica cretica]